MAQPYQEFKSPPPEIDRLRIIAGRLEKASAQEIIAWAFEEFGDSITIATGFGVEGVALIDMVTKINANPDVFFLDTGFLFPETYALRHQMEERYRIKIRAVRSSLTPESQEEAYGARLWTRDPDLCCQIRKLEPFKEAVHGFVAWMTAIRADQTAARRTARVVEWDDVWQLVKINPLVRWQKRDVWDYIAKNNLAYNPLYDVGYQSIGCTHCTSASSIEDGERAGRWSGFGKTECGLHVRNTKQLSERSYEYSCK